MRKLGVAVLRRVLVLALVLLGGCAAAGFPTGERGVERPCAAVYAAARCEAIGVAVATTLGVDPSQVAEVTILPQPTLEPGTIDRGGAVKVRLNLVDGRSMASMFSCPGVAGASQPECMSEPHLVLRTPIENGYGDIPGNATPIPAIDPAVDAKSAGLVVQRFEIPIAGPGPHRVKVGQATLPNGILRETSFGTEEAWPSNVVIRGGAVQLEVVPAAGGAPLTNLYEHGWREGLEVVDVFIVFDGVLVRPGAKLVITDLTVT